MAAVQIQRSMRGFLARREKLRLMMMSFLPPGQEKFEFCVKRFEKLQDMFKRAMDEGATLERDVSHAGLRIRDLKRNLAQMLVRRDRNADEITQHKVFMAWHAALASNDVILERMARVIREDKAKLLLRGKITGPIPDVLFSLALGIPQAKAISTGERFNVAGMLAGVFRSVHDKAGIKTSIPSLQRELGQGIRLQAAQRPRLLIRSEAERDQVMFDYDKVKKALDELSEHYWNSSALLGRKRKGIRYLMGRVEQALQEASEADDGFEAPLVAAAEEKKRQESEAELNARKALVQRLIDSFTQALNTAMNQQANEAERFMMGALTPYLAGSIGVKVARRREVKRIMDEVGESGAQALLGQLAPGGLLDKALEHPNPRPTMHREVVQEIEKLEADTAATMARHIKKHEVAQILDEEVENNTLIAAFLNKAPVKKGDRIATPLNGVRLRGDKPPVRDTVDVGQARLIASALGIRNKSEFVASLAGTKNKTGVMEEGEFDGDGGNSPTRSRSQSRLQTRGNTSRGGFMQSSVEPDYDLPTDYLHKDPSLLDSMLSSQNLSNYGAGRTQYYRVARNLSKLKRAPITGRSGNLMSLLRRADHANIRYEKMLHDADDSGVFHGLEGYGDGSVAHDAGGRIDPSTRLHLSALKQRGPPGAGQLRHESTLLTPPNMMTSADGNRSSMVGSLAQGSNAIDVQDSHDGPLPPIAAFSSPIGTMIPDVSHNMRGGKMHSVGPLKATTLLHLVTATPESLRAGGAAAAALKDTMRPVSAGPILAIHDFDGPASPPVKLAAGTLHRTGSPYKPPNILDLIRTGKSKLGLNEAGKMARSSGYSPDLWGRGTGMIDDEFSSDPGVVPMYGPGSSPNSSPNSRAQTRQKTATSGVRMNTAATTIPQLTGGPSHVLMPLVDLSQPSHDGNYGQPQGGTGAIPISGSRRGSLDAESAALASSGAVTSRRRMSVVDATNIMLRQELEQQMGTRVGERRMSFVAPNSTEGTLSAAFGANAAATARNGRRRSSINAASIAHALASARTGDDIMHNVATRVVAAGATMETLPDGTVQPRRASLINLGLTDEQKAELGILVAPEDQAPAPAGAGRRGSVVSGAGRRGSVVLGAGRRGSVVSTTGRRASVTGSEVAAGAGGRRLSTFFINAEGPRPVLLGDMAPPPSNDVTVPQTEPGSPGSPAADARTPSAGRSRASTARTNITPRSSTASAIGKRGGKGKTVEFAAPGSKPQTPLSLPALGDGRPKTPATAGSAAAAMMQGSVDGSMDGSLPLLGMGSYGSAPSDLDGLDTYSAMVENESATAAAAYMAGHSGTDESEGLTAFDSVATDMTGRVQLTGDGLRELERAKPGRLYKPPEIETFRKGKRDTGGSVAIGDEPPGFYRSVNTGKMRNEKAFDPFADAPFAGPMERQLLRIEEEIRSADAHAFPLDPYQYSVDDVGWWLTQLGLSKYRSVFEVSGISGERLLQMDSTDIQDVCGIKDWHDVAKIIKAREILRRRTPFYAVAKKAPENPMLTHKSSAPPLRQVFMWIRNGRLKDVSEALRHGFDLEAEDERGNSGLHVAVLNGHKRIVDLLVVRGADVNHQNRDGNTPLHFACDTRFKTKADPDGSMSRYLLLHGAQGFTHNKFGLEPSEGAGPFKGGEPGTSFGEQTGGGTSVASGLTDIVGLGAATARPGVAAGRIKRQGVSRLDSIDMYSHLSGSQAPSYENVDHPQQGQGQGQFEAFFMYVQT
jgi:hypothetical protein